MTPEAQRIAIAEVVGPWRFYPEADYVVVDNGSRVVMRYYLSEPEDIRRRLNLTEVPDYLSDLNAMAEAEKTLEHYDRYCCTLREIVWRDCGGNSPRYESATAAQRAEAFLRTLNKWQNQPTTNNKNT